MEACGKINAATRCELHLLLCIRASPDRKPNTFRLHKRCQCPGINFVGGSVVFEGGETYRAGTKELCYLGSEAGATTPVDVAEEFDCDVYSASAPTTNEHPYLVLDSTMVKSWDFGSGGFSCDTQLVREGQGGTGKVVLKENTCLKVAQVQVQLLLQGNLSAGGEEEQLKLVTRGLFSSG